MTTITFFRLYLAVPLVLSAAALLAFWVGWSPAWVPVGVVVGTLAASGIYGGIPYLVLALSAALWLRGKSYSQIRWLALRMPLLFALFFSLCALGFGLVVEGSITSGAALALIGVVYGIPLGYLYAVGGLALHRTLQRQGLVLSSHSSSTLPGH